VGSGTRLRSLLPLRREKRRDRGQGHEGRKLALSCRREGKEGGEKHVPPRTKGEDERERSSTTEKGRGSLLQEDWPSIVRGKGGGRSSFSRREGIPCGGVTSRLRGGEGRKHMRTLLAGRGKGPRKNRGKKKKRTAKEKEVPRPAKGIFSYRLSRGKKGGGGLTPRIKKGSP